jgi:hypothetical protein
LEGKVIAPGFVGEAELSRQICRSGSPAPEIVYRIYDPLEPVLGVVFVEDEKVFEEVLLEEFSVRGAESEDFQRFGGQKQLYFKNSRNFSGFNA